MSTRSSRPSCRRSAAGWSRPRGRGACWRRRCWPASCSSSSRTAGACRWRWATSSPGSAGDVPRRCMFQAKLDELTQQDPRYAYEAYEFVFAALAHTQELLGLSPRADGDAEDVTARELLVAIRDLAVREFGLLAPTVFRHWGVRR